MTFHPLPPVRRGELVAWVCTLGVAAVSGILFLRNGQVPALTTAILLVFSIAAGLISLGNWMDSHTAVTLSPKAVRHGSPLRNIELRWEMVQELWAMPVGKGWRIVVRGGERHFTFRTATEMHIGSDKALTIGFENGEELASLIVAGAGLSDCRRDGNSWVCRRKRPQDSID